MASLAVVPDKHRDGTVASRWNHVLVYKEVNFLLNLLTRNQTPHAQVFVAGELDTRHAGGRDAGCGVFGEGAEDVVVDP